MQYEKRKLSFDVAKVRRISAESKDLTKNFFELLRRYGGYATMGANRGEIVS